MKDGKTQIVALIACLLASMTVQCGEVFRMENMASDCVKMNESCPHDRRNVIVRGRFIICDCNEDRPKP